MTEARISITEDEIKTALAECEGEPAPAALHLAQQCFSRKPDGMSISEFDRAVRDLMDAYAAERPQ